MISVLRASIYACAAFLAVLVLTLLEKSEIDAGSVRIAAYASASAVASFAITDRLNFFKSGYWPLPIRVSLFGVGVVLISGMLLPVVGELLDSLRFGIRPDLWIFVAAPLLGVFLVAAAFWVVIPLGILASAMDYAITHRLPMPSNTSLERSRDR
jgi:hypothetical protein